MFDERFAGQGYSTSSSSVNADNKLESFKAPDDRWKGRLFEDASTV